MIAITGYFNHALAGSEIAKLRGEAPVGPLPPLDLGAVREVHEQVRAAVRSGALKSAHDIAEGGLAVALAECCIGGGVGAAIELADVGEVGLFGEAPGQAFIVSAASAEALQDAGLVRAHVIGRVGGDALSLSAGAVELNLPVSGLRDARERGLADLVT